MELKGEYRIPAPREQVWAMLNDPTVLRECIPGCETLEGSPADGFSARVTTKIGPVKATFNGAVTLTNVNPPESYTISGEGKGGVAGFAKGGADVHLASDGADTVLTYVANAQVGGKLAQLGSRLVDSTAKKLADQFFACFAERAGAPAGAAAAEPVILPGQPIPPAATGVPIVEGQAAAPETVPPIGVQAPPGPPRVDVEPLHHGTASAAVPPPTAASAAPGAGVQHLAHEVEEEVEREAAAGFLGGPIVWGLLVILALLFVYVIAT
jgi:carbon monoxide dehydrogenase subunit G